MVAQRIVSFLPSATEMICALGLADRLVGVTHECDFPPEVRSKPIVVRPAIPLEAMGPQEIDAVVSQRLRDGKSLYQVDELLLRQLAPDLILTQDLCQVCAPSGNEVSDLLKALPDSPRVVWMSPKSLDDIFDNLRQLGEATGRLPEAEQLIAHSRARIEQVAKVARRLTSRPRVFFMEWLDPIYSGGHWVPEMVELAGGTDVLGRKGTDSVRIPWDDVLRWAPEVLIVSPCGFHLDQVLSSLPRLLEYPNWSDVPALCQGQVYAVDANAYFARPGPRVVEGVELLAHILLHDQFDWNGAQTAYARLSVKPCSRCRRMFFCGSCGPRCWCASTAVSSNIAQQLSAKYDDCLCPKCLADAVR